MEEGELSWDFWSSGDITELAFSSDFTLIHPVFSVFVSFLPCFKAVEPLSHGRLFSKFKIKNCSYIKIILEEVSVTIICQEQRVFWSFYSYVIRSWYDQGVQEMVYEPEILVHKSTSSRLRKGKTRNSKTLQQIVRKHVSKKKKRKSMPKRNPSGWVLCWCKLMLLCCNLM